MCFQFIPLHKYIYKYTVIPFCMRIGKSFTAAISYTKIKDPRRRTYVRR